MSGNDEQYYPCVGICMSDPDSGYCLGCGRPPESPPEIVAELVQPTVKIPSPQDPESAE